MGESVIGGNRWENTLFFSLFQVDLRFSLNIAMISRNPQVIPKVDDIIIHYVYHPYINEIIIPCKREMQL